MKKKARSKPYVFLTLLTCWLSFTGCRIAEQDYPAQKPAEIPERQTFQLQHISPETAIDHLRVLKVEAGPGSAEENCVTVIGSAYEIELAQALLEVVDDREAYHVTRVAPASHLRQLPTNRQIAQIVGHVDIGTFEHPPLPGRMARAIIDVYDGDIVVVAPRLFRNDIMAVINLWEELPWQPVRITRADRSAEPDGGATPSSSSSPTESAEDEEASPSLPSFPALPQNPGITIRRGPQASAKQTNHPISNAQAGKESPSIATRSVGLDIQPDEAEPIRPAVLTSIDDFPNADDILELDLPEQLDLIQLIDLVGQHLDLDLMYDQNQMQGQLISLKLHGKLQGEIRIKDLYPLLESALRFKGFGMIRHQDNVVVIRPLAEALRADPKVITPQHGTDQILQPGDIIVTRVFKLRHLDTLSAADFVGNMELATAVTPIQETKSLVITGYAESLNRVAQLLNAIDTPGQRKTFRYRDLQFARAGEAATKIKELALRVGNLPVQMVPTQTPMAVGSNQALGPINPNPAAPLDIGAKAPAAEEAPEQAVHIDIDARINRIFMVGPKEQLAIVDRLIDAFDVPSRDGRTLGLYPIYRLEAAYVQWKLQELGIGRTSVDGHASVVRPGPSSPPTPNQNPQAGTMNNAEPSAVEPSADIVVLDNINALLVNAREQEHQRIESLIDYLDMPSHDRREMRVYEIEYVDAREVKETLEAIFLPRTEPSPKAFRPTSAANPTNLVPTTQVARAIMVKEEPNPTETQFIVLKSSNSLLVHAAADQHERIARSLTYIDRQVRSQAIPYEIYFLENQNPEKLAQVLQKLISETVGRDKEGKVQEVSVRINDEDSIVIVPDPSTYSLVVYANRRNQEWISKMISTLDRPSSQVLIDATLVEISQTDEFSYDLNLVSGIPDLVSVSGLMDPLKGDVTTADIMQSLQSSGRSRFAELQSNSGIGNGFYGDEHVMLLFKIMESKNYGRILAKPKVLVNDNETGTISTIDTTYIATSSQSALPGNTEAVITSLEYTGYDAGITLEITPHISQDELLRLEVSLNRTDFLPTEGEKPPNNTSSDIGTVVTIPDGSTIILGGMLKVNQNKGGKKVPGLGDLPLLGGLFRSTDNSNTQKRLYIFVKAEILRPGEAMNAVRSDLQRISDRNREAFETYEKRFQERESWPGVPSRTMDPEKALETE